MQPQFYDAVRADIFNGTMSAEQVDGCETIMAAWGSLEPSADPRWAAYSLATAFWETGRTMQPVREVGAGRGRSYGHPTGKWGQIYYGRGDVQETWERNYVFATSKLRVRGILTMVEDLDRTPDLALRPDISAAILVLGMAEGWFTGRKLSDFFTGTRSDWVDARTIINGHDKASTIAAFGLHFYHALQA